MGTRVMIVDDAPIIRLKIRDVLENHGLEVVAECGDGQQAIDTYPKIKPDVVTMDITMPNKDGIEALEGILKDFPDAKIIMVTAVDQRDSLMKAISLGATDYVVKPFEDDRIVTAIKEALK